MRYKMHPLQMGATVWQRFPRRGQVYKLQFWDAEGNAIRIGVAAWNRNPCWLAGPKLKFEDLTPSRSFARDANSLACASGLY